MLQWARKTNTVKVGKEICGTWKRTKYYYSWKLWVLDIVGF